jgi:cytosine/adenosine deaminase-related metal-dependent hydrolase
VGVSHCPSSNGRLGDGICRTADLLDAGIPVSIGVDGAASYEAGRLLPEIRMALLLARLRAEEPTALDTGTADLAVWPADDLGDTPDPLDALVLGADRSVEHLLVEGHFVVRSGALIGIDLTAARRRLGEVVQKLSR